MEPAWKAEKAAMDAADDGYGPYLDWCLCSEEAKLVRKRLWQEFVVWATDHLGQGYSLACSEGDMLDNTTHWAFRGYVAGRTAEAKS